MNHVVLVSDQTDEVRDNTSSSFKVRLPQPIELKGEGCKVGLGYISTPYASLELTQLTNALNEVLFQNRS